MNELIKVNYYNEQPTVSGRELHGFLQVGTAYKDWFPRTARSMAYGVIPITAMAIFVTSAEV